MGMCLFKVVTSSRLLLLLRHFPRQMRVSRTITVHLMTSLTIVKPTFCTVSLVVPLFVIPALKHLMGRFPILQLPFTENLLSIGNNLLAMGPVVCTVTFLRITPLLSFIMVVLYGGLALLEERFLLLVYATRRVRLLFARLRRRNLGTLHGLNLVTMAIRYRS